MAECRELEALFASYVDGEAAPVDCAAVDAHLRSCPPCRERVEGERIVRDTIATQRASLRPCASAALRRRCQANIAASGAGAMRPAPVRRAWVPLSMVASLVLAVAGVFLYGLNGGPEALASQLAVDHVKCFQVAPAPTIIPDAASLSREWAAVRGWTLKIPESAADERLELLGVRRCISTQGSTAHLLYKWRGQPLSVYVLNSVHPRIGAMPQIVEQLGQEAIMWSRGGRTYALVTRGRPSDLEHVVEYVRAAAQ